MTRNIEALHRSLRAFVVAPVAIVLAVLVGAGAVAGVILLVVAGMMLATAATGVCPTYMVIGIWTRPRGVHRDGRGIRHAHVSAASAGPGVRR